MASTGRQAMLRFGTEANVMAAMAQYGALTCSFNVHDSFSAQLRDGTLAAGMCTWAEPRATRATAAATLPPASAGAL